MQEVPPHISPRTYRQGYRPYEGQKIAPFLGYRVPISTPKVYILGYGYTQGYRGINPRVIVSKSHIRGVCQNYTSRGCQNYTSGGCQNYTSGSAKTGCRGRCQNYTEKSVSQYARGGGIFRVFRGVKIPHPGGAKIPHFGCQNPTTPGRPSPRAGSVKTDLRRSDETSCQETNKKENKTQKRKK